jgi:hypothetical protein
MPFNVIPFTGGKRCIECGEQIPPKRVMAVPNARKCAPCQTQREVEVHRHLKNAPLRAKSSVTIRW